MRKVFIVTALFLTALLASCGSGKIEPSPSSSATPITPSSSISPTTSSSSVMPSTSSQAPSTTNKSSTIPEYQKMTISHEKVNAKQKKNKEGDNGNHYGHNKDKDEIDEEIDDIVTIDVVTDGETKYYVQPNETFIVEVHLSNPDQFEIQSFTLNGQKYANYMFKEGSTMELLLLEITAPSNSGYVEYAIDAIKYIDGTEIKDVDMSKGDKSIKAGISYIEAPKATLSAINVGTSSVEFSLEITDPHNLIGDNELSLYLSDGQQVVSQKGLVVGSNRVVFDNLHISSLYQYGVVAVYDFVDGKDLHPEWLMVDTFATSSAYRFKNVAAGKTSISFEIEKLDEKVKIDSISLYDTVTDEKVGESDGSVTTFDSLLSDHIYNLYLDYSYELGDETFEDWIGEEEITTLPKVAPSLSFESLSSDKTSITYNVSTEDDDEILNITKVELLRDNEVVKDNGTELAGTFNNLLSNTEYSIKVSYTYDLNDGNDDVSKSISNEVSTTVKATPTLEIIKQDEKDDFDITTTSVKGSFALTDIDSVVSNVKVELIKDGEVVETLNNPNNLNNVVFKNLDLVTKYSLKTTCDYDLNDGEGKQTLVNEYEFTTCKYYSIFTDQNSDVIYEGYQKGNTPEFVGDLPAKESTNSSDFEFWKWDVVSLKDNIITYSPIFSECTKGLVIENGSVKKYEGTENNVIIPEHWGGYNITSIGARAFYGCKSVTQIIVPDGMKAIGEETFEGCSDLTSLMIPNSVDSLGRAIFHDCSSLTSIAFDGSIEQWEKILKDPNWCGSDIDIIIHCSDGDMSPKGFLFGEYPQSHVNDTSLITILDGLSETNSRGYYEYGGNEYCKVTAEYSIYDGDSGYFFDNGERITKGNEYWFKVEPIIWDVIGSDEEGYILLSKMVLEKSSFGESNAYDISSIRNWLNNDFQNKAFSGLEEQLLEMHVDNSLASTTFDINPYVCGDTDDFVTLISLKEAESVTRTALSTEYYRAVGGSVAVNKNAPYWTRTPSDTGYNYVATLNHKGNHIRNETFRFSIGIRPIIEVERKSQ